eukprot:TRINITY_DN3802_c0_g1_i1.p1 TRINITY_DN3802_c0_g1~~TRINITY_DN3802_c0_g1_i1.p1  ORF type:complete len:412 (+),score=59.22 TRINITY_DN3802_c0_g1_i1:389-1624(+)
MEPHKEEVVNKFIRYTTVNTTSNAGNAAEGIFPSTEGQRVLAEMIKNELHEIEDRRKLKFDVRWDGKILTAKIPGNTKSDMSIGFAPHLDTAPDWSTDTHATIVNYQSGDVRLGDTNTFVSETDLQQYKGQEIIFTDGTSLLGGDDKAAIASVMTAVDEVLANTEDRCDIYLAFLPDEEIGLLGAKHLAANLPDYNFTPKIGYCLDCCQIGEYVTETFIAWTCEIKIKGVPAHPMSSKGNLVNAVTLASDCIISKIPLEERPENTEQREGFFYCKNISGNEREVTLQVMLRFFDQSVMDEKKQFLENLVKSIPAEATITTSVTYTNPAETLSKHPVVTSLLLESFSELKITPRPLSMRGGYDGCALAPRLPFANFFTGAHYFHSNKEFLPIPSLVAAKKVAISLIRKASRL